MKTFFLLNAFGVLLLGGCSHAPETAVKIVPTATAASTPAPTPITKAPDAKTVHRAIALGAQYLVAACQSNGEFIYLDHLDPSVFYKPRYNEIRHAGALYALAEYYHFAKADSSLDAKQAQQTKSALVRASKYFTQRYIAPIGQSKDSPQVFGVWSRPDDGGGDKVEVKLGGNGLGLVGLLETERAAPGTTSPATLRALGRGLLFLQNADGSFVSKYSKAAGKQTSWNSLYYPGEAALGLTMLAQFERDAKLKKLWLDAAIKAVGYLARTRQGQTNLPADHWALIATAKFWPQYSAGDIVESRAPIMNHALQICNAILRDPMLHDARTTPVATRLEGLLAVYPILGEDQQNLKTQIKAAATTEIARLIATQVKSGALAGAIPRAFGAQAPSTPQPNASRDAEIRIDYVQHALSALMAYDRAILSKSKS